MRRPLLNRTKAPWYCGRLPSRPGSVSRRPRHAPPGREHGTVCDCAAFGSWLTPLGAAFFRLVRLLDWRFIPFKGGVLIQDPLRGIANRFGVHDLFVMDFPGIRLTQIADAFGLRIDHYDVLVTVRFLLAAVVQGLFGLIFRALAAPVGAVNNQCRRFSSALLLLGKLFWPPAGQYSQLIQRLLQYRQQALNPSVRPRLTQPKQLPQHGLQRIGLLIQQTKQEFLLCRRQLPFPPPAPLALAATPHRGLVFASLR